MKPLLLCALLSGLLTSVRAQGLRPADDEDRFQALPTLSAPGASASVWGLTVPVLLPRRGPLLVVDGRILPDSAAIPPPEAIIGLRELEPAEAVQRYGSRAARGALLIETERRRPRPRQ